MTMPSHNHPTLDARFLQPANWQWHYLRRDGYRLRYGYAQTHDIKAKGTIICLPGLSEFCEKYFEIAHEALHKGYNILVVDWRGQGASSRYLENSYKRHAQPFSYDIDDLDAILNDCPLTAGNASLFMLAHSMGGNIGMRYMIARPDRFQAAGFSAPMVGMHVFERTPTPISHAMTSVLPKLFGRCYAPFGGDWSPNIRDHTSDAVFSTDPLRSQVHNAWMSYNPKLQVGHVTYRWLKEAQLSCLTLQTDIASKPPLIPCVFGIAGHENFVDNTAMRRVIKHIPHAQSIDLPEARHEIMMESDNSRSQFLDAFFAMLDQ